MGIPATPATPTPDFIRIMSEIYLNLHNLHKSTFGLDKMNKLQHAQQFLKNGIAVIPLRHRGKEPEAGLIGGTWERYKTSLPTEYQLVQWLGSGWQNYGVVAGWKHLVVIDFDTPDAFAMWLDYFALINRHEEVYPMPYMVKTARGGHVYISMPGRTEGNEKRRGVDIKVHGYCVGPGSVHPSGTQYVAMGEFRLIEVYSLETILPLELYPHEEKTLLGASTCHLGHTNLTSGDYGKLQNTNTEYQEYDPFQAAMFANDVDLIGKVKQSVRIEQFFADVKRTSGDGRWLATWCPFHNDKRPGGTMSFWIDTARQLCGCATCGMKPMDAINFYSRAHNMSESDAVRAMAKEVGIWA